MKTIAIMIEKGGAGKTTTAAAVGHILAKTRSNGSGTAYAIQTLTWTRSRTPWPISTTWPKHGGKRDEN